MEKNKGVDPLVIALCGMAGAGKGMASTLLRERMPNIPSRLISTSELLKKDPKAKKLMDEGRMVPDDKVMSVVGKSVHDAILEGVRVIIVDGTPRNNVQTEAIFGLTQTLGAEIIMINILASQEVCIMRMRDNDRGRKDDKDPVAVKRRHRIYESEIAGIITRFGHLGVRCCMLDNSENDGGEKLYQQLLSNIAPYLPQETVVG